MALGRFHGRPLSPVRRAVDSERPDLLASSDSSRPLSPVAESRHAQHELLRLKVFVK